MFGYRIRETTSIEGTGTIELNGAVGTGFRAFSDEFVSGSRVGYIIVSIDSQTGDGDYEIGIGTLTHGTPDTITRDTVITSTASGAKVNWGPGQKVIFSDFLLIQHLLEDMAPDGDADFVEIYKASVGGARKVSVNNLNRGLVLLSSQTVSNQAAVDFTGLSDAYHNYVIHASDVVPQSDNTSLQIRVSEDGNTWEAGSGAYRWGRQAYGQAGTSSLSGSASDTEIEVISQLGNGTGETFAGTFEIFSPAGSLYKLIKWDATYYDQAAALWTIEGSGVYLSANPIVGVRLFQASGNISGKFELYGLRK